MAVVGYNFTKITAEKNTQPKGNIKVRSNISIVDVNSATLSISNEANGTLRINFLFTTSYGQDVGKIVIEGDVLFMNKKEVTDEVYKKWQETKKLDDKVAVEVLNNVLFNCNLKALNLSHDLGLPSPVQFPKVVMKDKEGNEQQQPQENTQAEQ